MSFGEALAMGLTKGIGQGLGQHYADQRREKFEMKKMATSMDIFKKQTQYRMGLENISKQNEALGSWESAAKLSTNDLAYQVATKMSSQFSKEDRPKFFRDSMKNLGGMSKAELLSRAGYNKPDYSQWIDNPEYADAIPKSRIAGMADMEGMDEVFKYDPRQYVEQQKVEGEKVTDYMRKKEDELGVINSMAVTTFGGKLSDSLASFVWKMRPSGTAVEMKGSEAISYDQTLLRSMIDSGQVLKVGAEYKLKGELDETEREALGIPTSTEQAAPVGTLYTEPQTEQYLTEQEEKVETKRLRSEAKNVEKNHGKTIKSYTSLQDLRGQLEGLSDDAKTILFGDASLKGALSFTDLGKRIAAKADVAGAQEARKFLALMTNISATLKHEQYGSAQTQTELKDFADQLGNPGILQNPQTLLDQIQTRMDLVGGDLSAAVGADGREGYLTQHPEMSETLSAVWGEPEGENGQVSDLGTEEATDAPQQFTTQGITDFVNQAIASGQYKESQRAELTAYMLQKAGLQQ